MIIMAPKRKAAVETVASPTKKAVAERKRKVMAIVEVPEEEEEVNGNGNGNGRKIRNTRNNAVVEIGGTLIHFLFY